MLPADLLGLGRGEVALRTDRAGLHAAGDGEVGFDAAVALVEYQGTSVAGPASRRPTGGEVQVLLDERGLRCRPGGRRPAGQPELAARPRRARWRPESARPSKSKEGTRCTATRYRVLDRTGGLSRRDVLRAALLGTAAAAASSFPAPFVHADDPITLRYAGTGVNAFRSCRTSARKIPASPSSTRR